MDDADDQIAERDQQPQPQKAPRGSPWIAHREAQPDQQRDAGHQHDRGMRHGPYPPMYRNRRPDRRRTGGPAPVSSAASPRGTTPNIRRASARGREDKERQKKG